MHKACAVEQDVDAVHACHLSGDGGFVEHIEHGGVHIGHTLVRLEQLRVHVGGVHGGTFVGHGQCGRLAYALPGGGDERDFSFESHGVWISRWVVCLWVMAAQSQAMPKPGMSGGMAKPS